jgi:dihydroxyacetone kinase
MALAARGVREQLAAAPGSSDAELVSRIALAMGSVGGAIGPLYASGLLAVASTLRNLRADEELSVDRVLAWSEAAETAISKLGRAAPGDKTVLDALHAAVVSLRRSQERGATAGDALNEAAAAAREGASSTAGMVATVGRASRLGERSRGLADPGATSFGLILTTLAATYFRHVAARRS